MSKQLAALATDEEHIVMWDVDAMLSDYRDHPTVTVDTSKLVPRDWLTIDREYAATTNVSTPILLLELPNNQLYVADGNHRLYRAVAEKVPQMKVIVIPEDRHLSYLYRSTEQIYRLVVDGLPINSKSKARAPFSL